MGSNRSLVFTVDDQELCEELYRLIADGDTEVGYAMVRFREMLDRFSSARKETNKHMVNYVAERKELARQEAIDWQSNFAENSYSWGELLEWESHFRDLGKRFGLLREFHENGIC